MKSTIEIKIRNLFFTLIFAFLQSLCRSNSQHWENIYGFLIQNFQSFLKKKFILLQKKNPFTYIEIITNRTNNYEFYVSICYMLINYLISSCIITFSFLNVYILFFFLQLQTQFIF